MKPLTMADAFNEWMRRYTETPEKFEHDWQVVYDYLKEKRVGVEPSYGASCEAYLRSLMKRKPRRRV